jgi:hypothetical protein
MTCNYTVATKPLVVGQLYSVVRLRYPVPFLGTMEAVQSCFVLRVVRQ